MATWVASLLTKTIRNQLELTKVNEDYEKILRPQIGKTTKKFIDAICVYITNTELQECDENTKTSSKKTIIDATDGLLQSYFDHNNNKVNMLAYKPIENAGKTLGGRKLAYEEFIIMGGGDPNIPIAAVGASANAGGTGIPALNVPSTGALSGVVNKKVGITGMDIPGMDIPNQDLNIDNITSLITSTKVNDVMTFYNKEVMSKLKCDEPMHKYIDEHIIQPVFAVASKNIDEVGPQHLNDLAKKTTESHLKKCILLIKGQLQTFGVILNGLSNPPADNAIPDIIIPKYINSLFELFVYSEYGLIVDMTVGITREDIKAYITKLKPFNVQIDNYIKDYKYPDGVMSMNSLKLPADWKTDEVSDADENKLISKDIVIAEFKKLFKPDVVKSKGGRRKSRTKKHKTRYLPVTKHGSRRKHP